MFKSYKKIIIFVLLSLSFIFVAKGFVLAQDFGTAYVNETGLVSDADPRVVAMNIIRVLLTFLGIIAISIVLYGGWLWMSSNGDSQKIDKAKKTLISAIIGLIIILSSFAIVSFVLNQMTDVLGGGGGSCNGGPACTGGQVCCGAFGCMDSCPTGGFFSESFQITRVIPQVDQTGVIRNVNVRVFFNKPISVFVDQATLNANFVIEKVADIDPITLVETPVVPTAVALENIGISAGRNVINARATANCVNEYNTPHCFDEWSRFRVRIDGWGGIDALGPEDLNCNGLCSYEFGTGDLVDGANPTAGIVSTQICYDDGTLLPDANTVRAWGRDDVGIAEMRFYESSVLAATIPGTLTQNQSAEHQYDTTGLTIGSIYDFEIQVEDMASNVASDIFSAEVHPGHCCNGVQDAGESGVDCGGDCLSCWGGSCSLDGTDECGGGDSNCSDDLCYTQFCGCEPAGCICQAAPIIDWITPEGGFCRDGGAPTDIFCKSDADCSAFTFGSCDLNTANGAEGNLITIGGEFFGNIPGTVTIDGINANLASVVNADCSGAWQDNQIVVEVPVGVSNGSVIVEVTENTGTYHDSNNDIRGVNFEFLVNNIERPGICSSTPKEGVIGTTVSYSGIRMIPGTDAFFGNISNSVEGINSLFTDVSGEVGSTYVPNIQRGRTTTFIESNDGVNSNYLLFTKNAEPYVGPYISYFTPIIGDTGQYVTIYGGGFGSASLGQLGVSHRVYFSTDTDVTTDTGSDQVEASYIFPDVCLDSLWSDNQIIIKTPEGLDNGSDYYLIIEVDSWSDTVDSSGVIAPGYSSTFEYNTGASLSPSLCKITPQVGPNNSQIEIYGEYFGDFVTGQVEFTDEVYQTGFTAANWMLEQGSGNNRYDYINTTIPQDAITGFVRVLQGADESNGINLRVGACTGDDDCEHVCCGAGSTEEGRCMASRDLCYSTKGSSVFEWNFDTDIDTASSGNSIVPIADFGCSGYDLLQCFNNYACPNSPGMCGISPYDPPLKSCDCDDYFPSLSLTYDTSVNRCVDASSNCSVDEDVVVNVGGVNISLFGWDAFCNDVSGAGDTYWQINPRRLNPPQMSCPNNWILDINGLCSLATTTGMGLQKATCDLCATDVNYTCISDGGVGDNIGYCAAMNRVICSSGTTCNAGTGECEPPFLTTESCECCCRKDSATQDCCTFEYGGEVRNLECAGSCGSDPTNYGVCSGCRIEDSGGVVDQDASDAACNCSGTSGKFCDVNADVDGDGSPEGVCRDCTLLDATSCNNHAGATTCCFDEKNGFCRGNSNGELIGGSCTYRDCNAGVCNATPVVNGEYSALDCEGECDLAGLPGGSSCYDNLLGNCGLTCDNPYSCFGDTGCAGGACGGADTTCACCCDPNAAVDTCDNISIDLICKPNQSPCSGENRGLCCGCESDNDCVSFGSPENVGCAEDACCRARPQVVTTTPLDNSTDVCRNTMIVVEFDQEMDITSFSDNLIVFADYGTDICPRGTQYLISRDNHGIEKKRNIFVRLLSSVLDDIVSFVNPILPDKFASAYSPVSVFNNYCSISGSISGYSNASEGGVLEFNPNDLLDPGIEYYVVVKGDRNLDSSTGVQSFWGVGLNGNDSNGNTFNGVSYDNSHIFSFVTMSDQGGGNYGVCNIDEVKINPSSYLFNTTNNDLNENDTDANSDSFDTESDSDKLFIARAYGSGSILATSTAYNWDWNWTVDNNSIVDFVGVVGLDTDKQLVRAQNGIVDGNTVVRVVANITAGGIGSFSGLSNVHVFECNNPWPPIATDGTWSPWSDNNSNCTHDNYNCGPTGTESCCGSTNFEFYYCRDNGTDSTYDDLAAILSNDAVVRAKDEFRCNGGFYNGATCLSDVDCALPVPGAGPAYSFECNSAGNCFADNGTVSVTGNSCIFNSECTVNGVCTGNLKEILYFREDLPDVDAVNLFVAAIPASGGEVGLSWNDVVDIDNYNLYYGTASRVYGTEPIVVDLSDLHSVGSPYLVTDLEDGVEYYFAITAVSDGTESEYSNEVSATPSDTLAPAVPSNFIATPVDGAVDLTWDEVIGAVEYEICYSVVSGNCSVSETIDTNSLRIIVDNGITNYFFIRAVDTAGNVSGDSTVESATPSEGAVGFFSSGDIILNWNVSGNVGDYILYYEEVD